MTAMRRAAKWMAAFSVVTLVLAAAREFVIARDLQASGDADLFFRGLVVVGVCRGFALALFRARWIPIGGATWGALLRGQAATIAGIIGLALGTLVVVLDPGEWSSPATLMFALAVPVAVCGSAVRALAERAGHERQAFLLEWALPVGTIAGALVLGRGAFGPAAGIVVGLVVGTAAVLPALLGPSSAVPPPGVADNRSRTPALLVDTLVYVNLGLLDGALSARIFAEGDYARLNYAYLFVNAVLAVPTTAATVLALRVAGRGAAAAATLRRYAGLGAVVVALVTAVVAVVLGWSPVAGLIDRAAGWSLAQAIVPIVWAAIPFAALRLANTIGRQHLVATDPRRLVGWSVAGLVARCVLLIGIVGSLGPLASPLALALAEVVQLIAWLRPAAQRDRDQIPPVAS